MSETVEVRAYSIIAGAEAALELAEEALALFEERRASVVGYGKSFNATNNLRIELLAPGPLANRAYIGAQAFLSNLVIVENSLAQLVKLPGLPVVIRTRAQNSLEEVRAVVDRRVRHSIEHIDDRAARVGEHPLVSSTILEGDFLCSTRADGSPGIVAITRQTLDVVTAALKGVVWPKENLDRLVAWAEAREANRKAFSKAQGDPNDAEHPSD